MIKHKRILEQITQNELVASFGQEVQVSYQPEGADPSFPELKGRLFVFSPERFEEMLDQVVEFTYHETFSLIKRQVNRND